MNKYLKIRNIQTDEEAIIDVRMSSYRRLCQGFLNTLRQKPYFLKHLTLTQKTESYKPNILHPFFVQLRRFYGDVVYFWTVEVQEERAEKYGDRVLHWHVIVCFSYDIDFGATDVLLLQRFWKYGNLDVKPVRSPSMSYLMKYITKSLDVGVESQYKLRRIGSSRIAAWLRQSWKNLCLAITFFLSVGISTDDFDNFYWSRGNAFIYTGDTRIHQTKNDDFRTFRERLYVYKKPSTPWHRVTDYIGEPF